MAASAAMSFERNKRAVFVTLEYADPIFSGNGVYSRSIVTALADHLGFDVLVVSGTSTSSPAAVSDESSSCTTAASRTTTSGGASTPASQRQPVATGTASPVAPSGHIAGTVRTIAIPLRVWNRLDRGADWQHFRDQTSSDDAAVVEAVIQFAPDFVVAVDWSGAAAARMLMEKTQLLAGCRTTFVLFVFRIFSASSEFSDEDLAFYRAEEGNAVRAADKIVSCSSIDRKLMADTFLRGQAGADDTCSKSSFLNPPLRAGFEVATPTFLTKTPNPPAEAPSTSSPSYLLCCCRLSPEKRVDFFVNVICRQEIQAALRRWNVVPFVVGALNSEWGKELIQGRLQNVYRLIGEDEAQDHASDPTAKQELRAVVRDFMSPTELRQVFTKSVLNFHPALYDSYAMTIVEAAACGLPSLIHTSGIGAADVLGEEGVFRGDMADENVCAGRLAAVLEGLVGGASSPAGALASCAAGVQQTAQTRALAWESVAFARKLGTLMEEARARRDD